MNVGDRIRYTGVIRYLRDKTGVIDAVYSTGWLHVTFNGDRNRSVVRVADCEKIEAGA